MSYVIINRDEDDMMGLRSQMRRNYRGGEYRNYGGSSAMMRNDGSMREHYYKMGYRHAMEDMEDDEQYRRQRDSRGRYV